MVKLNCDWLIGFMEAVSVVTLICKKYCNSTQQSSLQQLLWHTQIRENTHTLIQRQQITWYTSMNVI